MFETGGWPPFHVSYGTVCLSPARLPAVLNQGPGRRSDLMEPCRVERQALTRRRHHLRTLLHRSVGIEEADE